MNAPARPDRGRSPVRRITGWTPAQAARVVFFLVVEIAALLRKAPGDTFSGRWCSPFRLRERVPVPVRAVRPTVQVGFGIRLIGHLTFGWWSFSTGFGRIFLLRVASG